MGPAPARDAVFNDYARTLIRVKARQLTRRPGFSHSDEEDVEQDLNLHLLAKAGQYNPARASPNTFTARVVNSAAAMMLRDRGRLKRAAGFQSVSLDAVIGQGGDAPATLGERISEADLARRTGGDPEAEAEKRLLTAGVQTALAQLPSDLQQFCLAIMDGDTISSIAREMGTSRRQVRNWIEQVRRYFEQAGIEDFF